MDEAVGILRSHQIIKERDEKVVKDSKRDYDWYKSTCTYVPFGNSCMYMPPDFYKIYSA